VKEVQDKTKANEKGEEEKKKKSYEYWGSFPGIPGDKAGGTQS
jgi:hypothetical protein